MTRPRILLDPSLAGYFEPGLHEPLAEPAPKRVVSRYAPPRTVPDARRRVNLARGALQEAVEEWLALPLPDNPRQDWSKPQLDRVEAAHELLDRAVAELERLEAEQL